MIFNTKGELYIFNLLILKEHHIKGKSTWSPNWESCKCTYCSGDIKLHYGLNIPQNKRGWWVLKFGKGRYIRITKHNKIKNGK